MANFRSVHPEFERWVSRQTTAACGNALTEDTLLRSGLNLPVDDLRGLSNVSAKLVSGFFRPTKRTTVVWTEGDSELEVTIDDVSTEVGDGFIQLTIPVRCDQTGSQEISIPFAVGSPDLPAGVYASTLRRPAGPELVIDVWGDALVAYAWQIVLTLVTQVARASGKDPRGTGLVPAEIRATANGLTVVPMQRHRFFGSSGLLTSGRSSTGGLGGTGIVQ